MAHHSQKVKSKCRVDVISGMSLKQSATINNVPVSTLRQWKDAAKKKGDDWFLARTAYVMASGTHEEFAAEVFIDFTKMWKATVKATSDDKKMSPADKTDTIARLADSYAKFSKASKPYTPTLNKLATAMDVIKEFTQFVRQNNPELLPDFLELVEPFGAKLSEKYGK